MAEIPQPSHDETALPVGREYDTLLDPAAPNLTGSVEDAAVRPVTTNNDAERQAGIANADRQQREEKGMEPPVADLR